MPERTIMYTVAMSVDTDDPRHPYIQVADTLRTQIQTGQLPPGKRFPSIREIAADFGVAPATAYNAVTILKSEGLVVTHGPRGTFVRATPTTPKEG